MKRQRTFTHFNYKGADLGTFGTFTDNKDFLKLQKVFGRLDAFDTIHLTDVNIQQARVITGLELKTKKNENI